MDIASSVVAKVLARFEGGVASGLARAATRLERDTPAGLGVGAAEPLLRAAVSLADQADARLIAAGRDAAGVGSAFDVSA